jgi:hypothetical protein
MVLLTINSPIIRIFYYIFITRKQKVKLIYKNKSSLLTEQGLTKNLKKFVSIKLTIIQFKLLPIV